MEYLHEVKFAEVIDQWAKREHVQRQLLLHNRRPLLRELPKDTKWFKIRIQEDAVESLRVINEPASWNILSDSTGKLDCVAVNFLRFLEKPPELQHVLLADKLTLQQYFNNRMKSLQKFRDSAGDAGHNLVLVLITASKEGPFTVLEGSHTVMGLYFRYFVDHPELQYPTHDSYLGISALMYECPWYHRT